MKRFEYIELVMKNYDLVSVLSRKNDGEVLRLRHSYLKREIVLRSYPETIEAYNSLKTITHPNIADVYDSIVLEDGQIVIEEYVNGTTVDSVLQCQRYTYGGAKKVISYISAALETLHGLGFVHRDIKPENIMICDNGNVKLIDFNASRKFSNDKSNDTVFLGTVGYAPPEQFGIAQSDNKSDIYAIGVLLNVMLTGKHPSERLAKGKAGKIVLKCTLINPDNRFKSVSSLLKAL